MPTHPPTEGHEGATESTTPGTPQERQVIKPDWASLENDPLKCDTDGRAAEDGTPETEKRRAPDRA